MFYISCLKPVQTSEYRGLQISSTSKLSGITQGTKDFGLQKGEKLLSEPHLLEGL